VGGSQALSMNPARQFHAGKEGVVVIEAADHGLGRPGRHRLEHDFSIAAAVGVA